MMGIVSSSLRLRKKLYEIIISIHTFMNGDVGASLFIPIDRVASFSFKLLDA